MAAIGCEWTSVSDPQFSQEPWNKLSFIPSPRVDRGPQTSALFVSASHLLGDRLFEAAPLV